MPERKSEKKWKCILLCNFPKFSAFFISVGGSEGGDFFSKELFTMRSYPEGWQGQWGEIFSFRETLFTMVLSLSKRERAIDG